MHPREALATVLWPDCDAVSKKHLRQVLWQLQNALGEASRANSFPALCVDGEAIRINEAAFLRVDVELFEKAYQGARGVPSERMEAKQAKALQDAVLLYRGDLLEGCYQDWCLVERERLQNCYLAMLDKLILYCQKHQEYQQGIDYGERVLAFDRAHERSHQHLMRLHSLSGDRTAALRQYERCKTALREELGVKPSQQSTELYEEIREDLPAPEGAQEPSANEQGSSQTLLQMQRLLTHIGEVQNELKKQIRSVQQAEKSGRKMA
jgi:DNA-binding SARP family transcriptional activator